MKNQTGRFAAILPLALALFLGSLLAASAGESKPVHAPAALEKAQKIKLSVVKCSGLPLAEVITMLHEESVKRDTDGKGVKIALGPNVKQHADATVNIDLKDVTLAGALERIAESVSLEVEATDREVLLVRKRSKP
jgi:hypothetical protein